MKPSFRRLVLPVTIVACAAAALAASFFIAPLSPALVRASAAPPAQTIALRPVPWFSEKMHFHQGEPLAMSMAQLPKWTAIVASHAHYDHFDIESLKQYPDKTVPFFVGPDMADAARAAGFTNVREPRPWECVSVGPLKITAAPAARKAPEITFVSQANGSTVFFGGDTRLIPELRELPQRFPSIQLALLAINGLRVLGEQVAMNAEEAAEIAGHLWGADELNDAFYLAARQVLHCWSAALVRHVVVLRRAPFNLEHLSKKWLAEPRPDEP